MRIAQKSGFYWVLVAIYALTYSLIVLKRALTSPN